MLERGLFLRLGAGDGRGAALLAAAVDFEACIVEVRVVCPFPQGRTCAVASADWREEEEPRGSRAFGVLLSSGAECVAPAYGRWSVCPVCLRRRRASGVGDVGRMVSGGIVALFFFCERELRSGRCGPPSSIPPLSRRVCDLMVRRVFERETSAQQEEEEE